MSHRPVIITSRGSALALVQANMILDQCRAAFPERQFELKIIKTTGDKLQTASMANPDVSLPKGLFTKELEVALLAGDADIAVHSLKDLPTELPDGLKLGAVSERADVRDVMIRRGPSLPSGLPPGTTISTLPAKATVATSSTRRKAQLLAARPDLNVIEIRGNVATRLKKLHEQTSMHATLLAAAGLHRLNYLIQSDGALKGDDVPDGLFATLLPLDEMLPCVGQGALGMEVRENDPEIDLICQHLTHAETFHAVTAERSFLRAMGGGCQSPVGAHARVAAGQLSMEAVSFQHGPLRRAARSGPATNAAAIGRDIAKDLTQPTTTP